MTVTIHPEVAEALAANTPVVALESTVYSLLGLPAPANQEALDQCVAAIRAHGCVPAITAIIDGVPTVGLTDDQIELVLTAEHKIAERDIGVAIAQKWAVGVTTVAASLAISACAGIEVFATGGIGGVHRDSHLTGDISGDLPALAEHRVITVCAGAKAFLDLPKTLEDLETRRVPVLGWQTNELPAFYTQTSGLQVPHRVDTADEVAATFRAHNDISSGGVLVAAPPPAATALDQSLVDDAITVALAEAASAGVHGAAVTPMILSRIAAATEGKSIPANIALVANNADVAAQIAVALATHN